MKSGRRLLILFAILLPVPLAAATGLTIPLPATVERLAALLIPFADPASLGGSEAFTAGARGRIVETEDEVTLTKLLSADPTGERARARPVGARGSPVEGAKKRKASVKARPRPQVRVPKVKVPRVMPKPPWPSPEPPEPRPPKPAKVKPADDARRVR